MTGSYDQNYVDINYGKTAVLSAGREVLVRYLLYCDLHKTRLSHPGLDHKASTALAAVLISHLEGHTRGRANVLLHQRAQDLNLANKAIEQMERIEANSTGDSPLASRRRHCDNYSVSKLTWLAAADFAHGELQTRMPAARVAKHIKAALSSG